MRHYKNSDEVRATDVSTDAQVDLEMTGLGLFSSGAFSNVYRGTTKDVDGKDIEIVVKKTWAGDNVRTKSDEVKILRMLNKLKHKNIVRLLFTFEKNYPTNTCHSMVFEFMPLNLYQYLKLHNRRLHIVETKMFTWQMFRGLYHLQRVAICHRDLKPQNLLVNPETGLLKIGDFGSSAIHAERTPQPTYHVTRYYRPPELILGSKIYGVDIDVWSAGCVMGEMLRGAIVFPGNSSEHQMHLIMSAIGLPTDDDISAMHASKSKFKAIKESFKSKRVQSKGITKLVPISGDLCVPEAQDLLKRVLVYNPNNRLSGTNFLLNPFFLDLFNPDTRRPNGDSIRCLNVKDRQDVVNGDVSVTGSTESVDA